MRDKHVENPVEFAKYIGTYKLDDRDRQYTDPSPDAVLRHLNRMGRSFRRFKRNVYGTAWAAALGLIGWLATELFSRLK